jgi:Circadian oscillating protein COP23
MSNWRDRNERDAEPPTINNYYQENGKDKPSDTKKRIEPTIVGSLIGAIVSVIVAVVSAVYVNKDLSNPVRPSNTISTDSSPAYICERNESGRIETLAVDSNKKKRTFIVWNNNISPLRCEEVTERLNENKKLEDKKYIVYERNGYFERLCTLKSMNNSCDEEDIIYSINTSRQSNKSQAIYSFDMDNCTIYPNTMTNSSRRLAGSRQVCISTLQE